MKRQIVIWGGGKEGKNAYYKLIKEYEIMGFLDSDVQKNNLEVVDGKRILSISYELYFIVIACVQWNEVSKKLIEYGLYLYKNFIPYNMLVMKDIRLNYLLDCFGAKSIIEYLKRIKYSKKLALIYGNCQTEIIANMLEYNNEFKEQYFLLRVPQVHLYKNEEQIQEIFYKNNIMKLVDLFIYQNVKEDNRYCKKLGTDNILREVSNTCRKLPILNIYFDGYFVQWENNDEKYLRNMKDKNFPYYDKFIDSFVKKGKSVGESIKLLLSNDLLDKNEIIDKCKKSINILKEKEKFVDVFIADYIEENYWKHQIFYTHNHPKNIVIYEYVKRILNTIKIEKIDDFTEEELNLEFGNLRINNFPIFPCVINALGLRKYETKMRIFDITPELLTIENYIKEYIYRCYGKE